jgi:hypothetical protein
MDALRGTGNSSTWSDPISGPVATAEESGIGDPQSHLRIPAPTAQLFPNVVKKSLRMGGLADFGAGGGDASLPLDLPDQALGPAPIHVSVAKHLPFGPFMFYYFITGESRFP